MAISFGDDPLLLTAAANSLPWGKSEYDYAGGIRGQAVDAILGKHTGLPISAYSEIAIEGHCLPDQQRREGPYGEWTGYYASGERTEPIIKVKRMMHRNNPILTGAPSSRPPGGSDDNLVRSAFIWDHMGKSRRAGCQRGGSLSRPILHGGVDQATLPRTCQTGRMIAAQCGAGAYLGRYLVVLDDDIDPDAINDVRGPCARGRTRGRHGLYPPRRSRPPLPGDTEGQKRLRYLRRHRRHMP